MTTVSFEISDELAARLDASARARHTTRTELLREAVEKLASTTPDPQGPSFYDLSADLCGAGVSQFTDLATNPRHLEGFGS